MKIFFKCVCIFLLFASVRVRAQSTPITFDDLSTPTSGNYGTYGPVPASYAGLQWNNFYVYHGNPTIPSGFNAGVVSPTNVAFNNLAADATITSTSPFNILSAYLAAAWRDNLQVLVVGYNNAGAQVYRQSYTVLLTAPTLVNINCFDVTKVVFSSSGGTAHAGYAASAFQFVMDNLVYSTATVSASLSNVHAAQRTGTNLVDIYYDLSGVPAPVSVSALVSTNGGTNYSLQALNLSGDGITTSVASGSNYHMVWNAGTDFSNQVCLITRVQLSETLGGSSSQAASPIFTLDTRAGNTGTLTGTVLESKLNHPLTNAAVRLENMPFGTNTLNDGTFRLSNIPVGKGYVLDVSAAGYASRRLVSVNVPVGTNNLGNIILTNMSGPYRLVPLVPDINPSVTTVEQGGTAYRYYVVLNASNAPQGGISVSAQVAGGSVMVQTNDISDYWPGRIAGISDPQDGVVRISITNSILSQNGAVQSIQLSISNVVQQTFQAQAVPRQYDQIWKQTVGGGVGGDIYKIVSGEIDTSAESELRHTIVGGINTSESISRSREAKFAVGVGIPGIDVGASLKTSNINVQGGGGLSAGGDGFLAIILNSQFFFDPNTVDANQNLMKLYVDLGNVLTGTPIGNRLYTVIDQIVAPVILVSGTNLNSIECDVQAGAEAQGQVGLAIANNQKTHVIPIAPYVNISGDLEIKAIYGYKAVFGKDANAASIAGWERSGSGSFSSVFSDQLYSLGRGYEQDQLDWILANQSSFEQPLSIAKVDANAGTANSSSSWKQYDPAELNASYAREFTELLVASNDGSLTNYERLIFASAVGTQAGFNLDFGPKISFNLELDRGAEIVNERGAFLSRNQSKYWPTESYPPITTNLFPTQSWSSILGQWGNNATAPIGQAVNQAVTVIQNAGNTIVKAGQATLNIVGGALSSGSKVISSWVSSWFAGHKPAVAYGLKPNGGAASASYLPADGATNYVYGIDGVYQFSSTNPFSGTATLVIPFNSADVVGLNPADLRIYQLPDGSNRWQLVGGIVDTVSNTVTATITNLGTFALAPPLPTGDLQLILSTNALPADGVSTLAVNVTNILLNTGLVATQQWLFTATVVGAQLLNPDCDTNLPGIQVMSTNGAITLLLQAPSGGTVANMALASVAGDAYGSTAINIIDTTPPATPANVALIAGQSRIWVSWRTNSEADLAGYRVYYSAFTAGPPWTGTAAIEGTPSPVQVTGTNCLLRGLSLGTNYYIAVSAVDSSGNESPLSTPVHVTTIQSAPAAPTGVTARFGNDGTNLLMWALSEDDGYNDRDVSQYYIWRAILPGGSYVKIGQVAAGTGLYCTTNLPLPSAQYLDYEVSVVDSSSLTSTSPSATDIMPVGMSIIAPKILNKQFQLTLTNGVLNQTYILWSSTNLVNWTPVVTNLYTNSSVIFYDVKSTNYSRRFYKIGY